MNVYLIEYFKDMYETYIFYVLSKDWKDVIKFQYTIYFDHPVTSTLLKIHSVWHGNNSVILCIMYLECCREKKFTG